MNLEVTVPIISEGIDEFKIKKWLKSDRDFVKKDEAICTIETEKANLEIPAKEGGFLKIRSEINQVIKIGEVIALIERPYTQIIRKSTMTQKLVDVIHYLHQKGWSPATSTNYSFISSETIFLDKGETAIVISKSGIDKSKFTVDDFMLIDKNGQALPEFQEFKSSAETLLHTLIYRKTDAKVILHTHSQFATILSQYLLDKKEIIFENYEVLKGLDNIKTHEISISIPIFENSQDMKNLSKKIEVFWDKDEYMQGFLLAGHGLYTWGKDLKTAKRKLEVLEFLLECEYYKMSLNKP